MDLSSPGLMAEAMRVNKSTSWRLSLGYTDNLAAIIDVCLWDIAKAAKVRRSPLPLCRDTGEHADKQERTVARGLLSTLAQLNNYINETITHPPWYPRTALRLLMPPHALDATKV